MGGLSGANQVSGREIEVTIKDGEINFGGGFAHGFATSELQRAGLTITDLENYLEGEGLLDEVTSAHSRVVRVKIADLLASKGKAA